MENRTSAPTRSPNIPFMRLPSFLHTLQQSGVNNEAEEDNGSHSPIECDACAQVGVPILHSTSSGQTDQPELEAFAGSHLAPVKSRSNRPSSGAFGRILDPRSKKVQRWNRIVLLARGVALAIDPLFFFAVSIGGGNKPCIYLDRGVRLVATLLRTCVDLVHLWHLWVQFHLAYVSRESLVVGCGKLVCDARAIASHYINSLHGFWFDAFVILPIPQAVYGLVVPKLLREGRIDLMMFVLQFIFLLQFLPKVYHSFCLMQKMRKVTGFVFGTIWWGFGLNLIAYFLASHASGGYWYILSIWRIASCLAQQCHRNKKCSPSLSCARDVCYRTFETHRGDSSTTMDKTPLCLDVDGPFSFGIYRLILPLISRDSITIKVLYCNLWGLMALSTMGNNLTPTSQCLEVIFSICMVLFGLMLFTLLVGNIQVFLHAVMVRRRKMQLRYRDLEWWMRRRQLPSYLRYRVRHFEHQRWASMGGEDEAELIKDLPQGLRLDIKRHLCLDLIKKVPLFRNLDDIIFDNICDRVKPLVYSKGEKIISEGDPVQRMMFVLHGQIKRSQGLSNGLVATSMLEPGSFLGDELVTWCLRLRHCNSRPYVDRLPASSATFTCMEPTEAFGLLAEDLRYITDHFRYKFANEKIRQTLRYYSSNWRTWAAVNIQLAWRRYIRHKRGSAGQLMDDGCNEHRLRQCAAMFLSLKPHKHIQ